MESNEPHLRKRLHRVEVSNIDWVDGAEAHQGVFYAREEGVVGWVEVCGLIESANGGRETDDCGARSLA